MELKPGYKQTEVGPVPEDWDVVLLDSVARRASGHTPDKTHPEYWGGDIKWVSLADSQRLDNLYISETAATITPEGIANSSANLLPAGSCIVSRDAGVGKSAILAEPMAVSQHFMAWNCGPRLSNHYLYFLLQAMKPELERIAIGNTIKTIGLPYFKALRIQLPSIEEQNSIASALTDIDQFIRRLERSIAKKQGIKQAAMQELLTGKRRLPGFEGEWVVKRLGDEIRDLEAGVSVRSTTDKDQPSTGRYILKTSAVSQGQFSPTETKEIISSDISRAKTPIKAGDLIISRMNTPALVGECGYSHSDHPNLFLPDRLWRAAYHDPQAVSSRWLSYTLSTKQNRTRIKELATGTSGSMKNISKRSLLDLEIRWPSLDEQKAIAEALSEMDDDIDAINTRLQKAQALKQGMMQQLLTGKIRLK